MTLDVRELLRRLQAGQKHRAIARDLGVARKTVAKYDELAHEQGLLAGPLPAVGDLDRLLSAMVADAPLPRQSFKAEKHRAKIETLRKGGVEIMAVFKRLCEEDKYQGSYSALRRYVVHLEQTAPVAFVRLETPLGEEAQVDFGSAGRMIDPRTGELRKAWVFVMTLSCSRHQYAELVFDQRVETWLRCHRHAFEAFGGVPRRIVLDNLKAAIVKASLYDPVVQRSYRQLAEHYGFLISPCRVCTPEHKGKVESGVHYVKRNFLAGRAPMTLTEANEKLAKWVAETAGLRRHGTTKQQPLVQFREQEQAALLLLPQTAYDLGVWKQVKLHPDCHVVVEGAYYSAPHRLIGARLWARTNGRDVVLYHDWERIATHPWGRPGTRRTIDDHYPPDKLAFLMATPTYCRRRAKEIGPATADTVESLFAERPLDRLRSVQSLLRLADKYGAVRLEQACTRARLYDETSPRAIARILERGLDCLPLPTTAAAATVLPGAFVFARPGSEIFPLEGGPSHGH